MSAMKHRDFYRPEDLAGVPDDGQRYEIIDGSLVVTPMAGGEHQLAAMELAVQLRLAQMEGLLVLPGAELHLGEEAVIPDVVVVRDRRPLPTWFAPVDVALVLEVTSPHQEARDIVTKRALYERHGIDCYIIANRGELIALQLESGHYVERERGRRIGFPVALELP